MSILLEEALESPEVVERQLADPSRVQHLAESLAGQQPDIAVTLARGSAMHAAHYFSTLALSQLGLPAPPLLDVPPGGRLPARSMRGLAALAFSQAGQHPELTRTVAALAESGARTIALVNAGQSPLGEVSEAHLPLLAGHEAGAAAVKSHIGMLSRSAQLVAYWVHFARGDRTLLNAIQSLPQIMAWSCMQDWVAGVEQLADARRLSIVADAPAIGVARELALTLMVTCGLHADAFPAGTLTAGPAALFEPQKPVLVLAPRGEGQAELIGFAARLRACGATVLLAAPATADGVDLPLVCADDPALDPVAAMQSLYVLAAHLAECRACRVDLAPAAAAYSGLRPVTRFDVSRAEV